MKDFAYIVFRTNQSTLSVAFEFSTDHVSFCVYVRLRLSKIEKKESLFRIYSSMKIRKIPNAIRAQWVSKNN